MIKSNVRSHSIFRPIFAAIGLLFAAGAVVQPAAAVVLSQTTQQMPSLATFNNQLYLAWAGTDSAHHLNVAASSNGTTFGAPSVSANWAASDTGPAITAFNNRLYIVWAQSGNQLNIASSGDGVNFSSPSFVSTFTSSCSPALTASATVLYLAWCPGPVGGSTVVVSTSTDGLTWSAFTQPNQIGTASTPALAVYNSELVLAFTALPSFSATLVYSAPATSSLPPVGSWTGNQGATIGGNSNGGPGLAALNGSLYMGKFNPSEIPFVYTLQTGSSGLLTLITDQTIPGTVTSATNPAVAAFNGHIFFAWKGTDNPAHLNIVEVL
jgi:hypothetical protein